MTDDKLTDEQLTRIGEAFQWCMSHKRLAHRFLWRGNVDGISIRYERAKMNTSYLFSWFELLNTTTSVEDLFTNQADELLQGFFKEGK